jgi:tripeptide aminopeptidase
LKNYIGTGLIVTDGNTLLGADDKAGLAIIMAAVEHYIRHPEEKHHPIAILFTPDEEIGRGPEHFDAKRFGAAYAYTLDGADPDIIEDENFNAAHADITIEGVSIHPGEAKGKLVNALHRRTSSMICSIRKSGRNSPRNGKASTTSLPSMAPPKAARSTTSSATTTGKLEHQKDEFINAQKVLSKKYPKAKINLVIKDDYRNMHEVFEKDPRAVEHADKVYAAMGVKVRHEPIRGGTDGATFSFLGCPTPNLGTGSYNHHGRFEYLSEKDFKQMIALTIAILKA